MLVFDVTDHNSFSSMDGWRTFFLANQKKGRGDIPFVLVGNKADREAEREVQWSEAQTWARSHHMPYFEVSALQGTNVEAAFEEVVRLALRNKRLHS